MNEYPITNIRALYADKATEGGELDNAIKAAATEEELQALADVVNGLVVFEGEVQSQYDSGRVSFPANSFKATTGNTRKWYKDTGYLHGLVQVSESYSGHVSVCVFSFDDGSIKTYGNTGSQTVDEIIYVDNTALSYLNTYFNGSNKWDTTPTENSTKPVTSGGVYAAINAIVPGTKLYLHSITFDNYLTLKPVTIDSNSKFVRGTGVVGTYASKSIYLISTYPNAITAMSDLAGYFKIWKGAAHETNGYSPINALCDNITGVLWTVNTTGDVSLYSFDLPSGALTDEVTAL